MVSQEGFSPPTSATTSPCSPPELLRQDVGDLTLPVSVMAPTNHDEESSLFYASFPNRSLTREPPVYSPGGGFLARG